MVGIEITHVMIYFTQKEYIFCTSHEEIGHFGKMAGLLNKANIQDNLQTFFNIHKNNENCL